MEPVLEKKQPSQGAKIYKIIQEYSEYSTIQGVLYIFQINQSQVGRIFWSLIIFAMLLLGTYWSVLAYSDWQSNPVLTTVKTSALPIKEIEFPAVTICSQGLNTDIATAGQQQFVFELYSISS
jgi:hypothetical protein